MKKSIKYCVNILLVLLVCITIVEFYFRFFQSSQVSQNKILFERRLTSWQLAKDDLQDKYNVYHTDTLFQNDSINFIGRILNNTNKDSINAIALIGDSMLDGFNDSNTKPIDYYLDSILNHQFTILNYSKSGIAHAHQSLFENYIQSKYSKLYSVRTICMFDDFIPNYFLKTDYTNNQKLIVNVHDHSYQAILSRANQVMPLAKSAFFLRFFKNEMSVSARYRVSNQEDVLNRTVQYFEKNDNQLLIIIPPSFVIQNNQWMIYATAYSDLKNKLKDKLNQKNISYVFIDELIPSNTIQYQDDQTHFNTSTNRMIAQAIKDSFLLPRIKK